MFKFKVGASVFLGIFFAVVGVVDILSVILNIVDFTAGRIAIVVRNAFDRIFNLRDLKRISPLLTFMWQLDPFSEHDRKHRHIIINVLVEQFFGRQDGVEVSEQILVAEQMMLVLGIAVGFIPFDIGLDAEKFLVDAEFLDIASFRVAANEFCATLVEA